MENNELGLIPEETEAEKPKFYYEPTFEATEQVPIYDADGNQMGTETRVTGRILKKVWTGEEELLKQQSRQRITSLKTELAKIKEDIEQEVFGLVRDDYAEKKARAAEIINELRVLENKEPREIKGENNNGR